MKKGCIGKIQPISFGIVCKELVFGMKLWVFSSITYS